jgi:hypothetical protein
VIVLKKGITNRNFKGFVADDMQVNWNVVCIIFAIKDLAMKMVDKE